MFTSFTNFQHFCHRMPSYFSHSAQQTSAVPGFPGEIRYVYTFHFFLRFLPAIFFQLSKLLLPDFLVQNRGQPQFILSSSIQYDLFSMICPVLIQFSMVFFFGSHPSWCLWIGLRREHFKKPPYFFGEIMGN